MSQEPKDPAEFQELQKLLRLKRYEQPPPEFFEDFLLDFQKRQRAEMLKTPVTQLMAERLAAWWNGLIAPRWLYAGGAAYVAAMIFFFHHNSKPTGMAELQAAKARAAAGANGHGPTIMVSQPSSTLPPSGQPGMVPVGDTKLPAQAPGKNRLPVRIQPEGSVNDLLTPQPAGGAAPGTGGPTVIIVK